jgi:hypothetical protein
MDIGRIFESKLVILLAVGVGLIVVAKIMKRGRLDTDPPAVIERILWAAGLLMCLSGILVGVLRCDVVDVPKKDKKQIEEFSRDGSPGCSKPRKEIREFDNKKK